MSKELFEKYNYLFDFKCENCGQTLEYYKGVYDKTDYIGCPNRLNCNFKNTSANDAIYIYRQYILLLSKFDKK